MSNYVNGSSFSYRGYLQARSFEDALKSHISKQTRLLIASNEEFQRDHSSDSIGTLATGEVMTDY